MTYQLATSTLNLLALLKLMLFYLLYEYMQEYQYQIHADLATSPNTYTYIVSWYIQFT